MSNAEQTLSDRIAEQLKDIFASVADSQREYYQKNPGKRPGTNQASYVISHYANMNAMIAGTASLVPGPWGMLSIVPEIILVIRNQLKMIYDLSIVYEKDQFMDKDLLLGIFSYAMGSGALGLVTVKGGQVLVRRTSLRFLQRIITWLGGKITQRVLKQFLSRWVPIAGAVVMAVWARHSTTELGNKAVEVLSKDFKFTDDEADVDPD